jgi:hypothetical protein
VKCAALFSSYPSWFTTEGIVLRNVLLFFTALLLALTAGRAFWVWLGENPFNMSGATYVEFFQQLDERIAIAIAVTGLGGTHIPKAEWSPTRTYTTRLSGFWFDVSASSGVRSERKENKESSTGAVVHIFRFEHDRIAELWDVGQPVSKDSPNENGMF